MPKSRYKQVCDECGSENVMADAYAKWDTEDQEWHLVEAFAKGSYCNDCVDETTVKAVKIEEEDK